MGATDAKAPSFPPPEDEEETKGVALELVPRESEPSFKKWALYEGLRPWMLLAFLILDIWLFLTWYSVGLIVAGAVSLVPAAYAEVLLYRYLWYRPDLEERGPFRRTWLRLVRAGRWTPEGELLRAGKGLPVADTTGRKREEFL
jgi:hypothetical protein